MSKSKWLMKNQSVFSSEDDSFQVTCHVCSGSFEVLKTQNVDKLVCGHWMCHDCFYKLFALSIFMPQYMPPRCCELPQAKRAESMSSRILVSPEVNKIWEQAKALGSENWECSERHLTIPELLEITTGPRRVWKITLVCDLCAEKYGHESPLALRCLFCKKPASSDSCRCLEILHSIASPRFCTTMRGCSSKASKLGEDLDYAYSLARSQASVDVEYQFWGEIEGQKTNKLYSPAAPVSPPESEAGDFPWTSSAIPPPPAAAPLAPAPPNQTPAAEPGTCPRCRTIRYVYDGGERPSIDGSDFW